ncbi:MAG: fasciclin domain-containing protein, partial [Myxococcales bacterium]|nr:fasciclin domain-containing protein [Myxococcales bacterium]
IFAPTDDAFAAVDDATLDALLQPRNRDALVEVLSLHVVAGRVTASDAVAAGRASSLRDRELTFTITDGRLRVNDANVIANDLAATNGVVHVIDRVLLPDHLALQPESTPLRLLELAVERGAPLFNAGQHAACAAIYEIAAEAARLTSSERLAPSTIRTLDDALAEARSPQAHAATVAWSLRRALDAAYRDLDSLP